MLGPRRGLISASSASGASRARAPVARPASLSRSRSPAEKPKETVEKPKKEKEFAWMDSDDESEKAEPSPVVRAGSSSPSRSREVPLYEVQTLGQMARLAPKLEKRLQEGEVRSRELGQIVEALSRSKFFDSGLFSHLSSELQRTFRKQRLGVEETLQIVCALSDLNAYDAALFDSACEALRPGMKEMPEPLRIRLESALKKVKHDPGGDFFTVLQMRPPDKREACPMFWRGQCKWGPKCKLSHDQESFEGAAREGSWKPPSMSGGRSVGFKQSSDLFKADRCGALW